MASNLLWAHLLRKDATTADSPSQVPPIAPQDKTGTSMRMLIHDTQVNLEKFSTRLDGLLQRVDTCRDQVVNTNKLLDVERDRVLTEILEIAHRYQSEMKAHVGTPAQASALDLVQVSQVSTEKSVQALERRIDALQALLQTHVHMMQSIQDQQNTLISIVMPLVPILHDVSPQMDQIKAALSDVVSNAVSTLTNSLENVRSARVTEFSHEHGRPARLETSSRPISSPRRVQSDASVPQDIAVHVSSPLDNQGNRGGPRFGLKRARVEGTIHHVGDVPLSRKLSRLAEPQANSPPLLRTPKTPRRPLADLLIIPGRNTPGVQHHGCMNSTPRGYMRPPETLLAASSRSTDVPLMPRLPLQTLGHDRPVLEDSTINGQRFAGSHDMYLLANHSVTGLSSTNGPSGQDTLLKEIKMEVVSEPSLTDVISIHSSPPSPSLPPAIYDVNETSTSSAQPSTRRYSRSQGGVSPVELIQLPSPSHLNSDASPPRSMSLRDRRAQISKTGRMETRPFISLGSWSDEAE